MDDQLLTEEVQQLYTFENLYHMCYTIQYRKSTQINPTKVHGYRTSSELLAESYKPDTSHNDIL